ncbi:alpha/beta-hydrolase [Aulographum hederae CBS 113979]|uniref:Alpha/beta-hydrolase n=1 Tax=Aulographum hederae CBS 113979 TaxID=1176131 RepID=A0A6G1GP91_9PEZI|nr:alpha/beta-hydrolase [Aulographum hederae CBS 113979]
MAPSFRCSYKTVDDCIIYADVYTPFSPPKQSAKCPVVINIHGGAFMLGHSAMVNPDQVDDMRLRGWIVVAAEHRLCPQIDILEGPITDARDLLACIYDGGLDKELQARDETKGFGVDMERVCAFGTSSGGTLALALGFGVPKPVCAILDFYGATNFTDPFWSEPLSWITSPQASQEAIDEVYNESPIPIRGGMSLEGQSDPSNPPRPDARALFALTQIAEGKVVSTCFPSGEFAKIDACLNVDENFPPTCIVHGQEDKHVPMHLSRTLWAALEKAGVVREFIEVPGEGHTFAGKMVKGSDTWEVQKKGFDWLEVQMGAT